MRNEVISEKTEPAFAEGFGVASVQRRTSNVEFRRLSEDRQGDGVDAVTVFLARVFALAMLLAAFPALSSLFPLTEQR